MKELIETGTGKIYQLFNGTHYHKDTPENLVRVLDNCINYRRNTVRVYYGDTKTGKCWNEEHDVRGHIGRSMGTIKIPLLVHTLSYGGPGLLDHCILKIIDIKTKTVLYQHPKFIQHVVTITDSDLPEYAYNICIDGELYGRCKTYRSAILLKTKMS